MNYFHYINMIITLTKLIFTN